MTKQSIFEKEKPKTDEMIIKEFYEKKKRIKDFITYELPSISPRSFR